MISSQQAFGHARLKVIRANQHIVNLKNIAKTFLDNNRGIISIEDDPDGVGQLVKLTSENGIPSEIPTIAGDAIHNLRCALDFVITELSGRENSTLSFPFHETREELIRSLATDGREPCFTCGKGGSISKFRTIEAVAPGITEFIVDEIRPYKAADGLLWPISKLDNRDKHRLLMTVAVPISVTGFQATDENNGTFAMQFDDIPFGQEIVLIRTSAPIATIENYGTTTADVFFDERGVLERKAIVPTLLQMSHLVVKTIDSIEKFAISAGWKPTIS